MLLEKIGILYLFALKQVWFEPQKMLYIIEYLS